MTRLKDLKLLLTHTEQRHQDPVYQQKNRTQPSTEKSNRYWPECLRGDDDVQHPWPLHEMAWDGEEVESTAQGSPWFWLGPNPRKRTDAASSHAFLRRENQLPNAGVRAKRGRWKN